MKPRVLLDCDGVLADFVGRALDILNASLGTSYEPADIWQFDIAESLRLTEEQASQMKRSIGNSPRLANELSVYPGSISGVNRLRDVAEVYIVTSSWDSNETWEYDRKAWLRRNFGIRHHDIVFTAAKHVCVGDFLVDDKTSTLEKWQDAHPTGVAVQWQTPHNRRDPWSGPATGSWDELIGWVAPTRAP